MAVYPGGLRSFNTKIDLQDTVFAQHINDLQDEMVAVQTELGTVPKGASASVKARLDTVESSRSLTSHVHDGYHLRAVDHDVTARHTFGAAYGTPGAPSTQTFGDASLVGSGAAPPREDHKHAWPTVRQAQDALIPAGVIWGYGGISAPAGWLFCDGASYLRTDYPALFTAIGVRYGNVDGTHFNVPNFLGRGLVGCATTSTAVTSGGSRDATIVSHAHPGSSVTAGNAVHTHYVEHQHGTGDAGGHTHSMYSGQAGTNDIVCVSVGGPQNAQRLVSSTNPDGQNYITTGHVYDPGNHNHGGTGNMNQRATSDGASGSANHGHGLTVATQGSSATDANMPPYQTANFIIKVS